MSRVFFGIVSVVLLVAPERVVRQYEAVAIENRESVRRKPSFLPAIRAEGLGLLVLAGSGGSSYRFAMTLYGVGGALAAAFPRHTMALSATVT